MRGSIVKSEYSSIMDKFVSAYGRESFDNFAHFAGMKGRQYDRQDRLRMMLVGRSTNGWQSASAGLDSKSFGKRMEDIFLDRNCTSFDWIHTDPSRPGVFTNGEEYSLGRSDFWNYTGELWRQLNERLNKPIVDLSKYDYRWFEFIAWTNLYKVTEQGKTPGLRMTRLQLPECMEILKEEIDTWKPNLILIESDADWFSGFSPLFSSIEIVRNPIVKVAARYNNAPVLVTIRPERQNREKFVSNILEVLEEINSQVL